MVSFNAQRPGDIVKSYISKTIEVLNTDAEGRLVLADNFEHLQNVNLNQNLYIYLCYFIRCYNCLFGIYIFLFLDFFLMMTNLLKYLIQDQKLKRKYREFLIKIIEKLINSKNADVQNIDYVGGAGSTTA